LTGISQKDQASSTASVAQNVLSSTQAQAANHSLPMQLWGAAKEAARDAVAITMAPYEYITAYSRGVGNEKNPLGKLLQNPLDVAKQTTFGQYLMQGFNTKNKSRLDPMGNGIFPGGTAAAAARAEGNKIWSVNGEPANAGNLLASGIHLDPNSSAYKVTDAVTNMLLQFHADPTIIAGKAKQVEEAVKTSKATATATKSAANIQADAARASLESRVNAMKSELEGLGKTVNDTKIASAKDMAENAKTLVDAPSSVIHASDSGILDIKDSIAKAQQLRNETAQVRDAIQSSHDEFQKTIAEGSDVTNPYAQRLADANNQIKQYDSMAAALKTQIKPLEDARRATSAILTKAMEDHATDLIAKTQADLTDITSKQAALKNNLSSALDHLAGVVKTPEGLTTDYNQVAELISGRYGEPLIEHIINSKNPIEIWRDFKKSIPLDVAVQLANATDRQSALGILAPLIGGKIESTLPMTAAAKITAGTDGLGYRTLPNWVKNTMLKADDKIQSLTGFVPKGQIYHLDDINGLADAIDRYGKYMKLPKATIDELLNKLISADSNSNRGMVASRDLFNSIFSNIEGGLNNFQRKALYEATRVFDGGKTGMSQFWASRHAAGAHLDFAIGNGKKITLNGPHLESELLNSSIYLPSPTEMKAIVSVLGKTKTSATARAVTMSTMDLWRTSKLLRPAYMVRNLMEMQVRQYLQGSVSFVQHPAASIAMILGKSDGPAWRQLLARHEQYATDILGNSWKSYINPEDDLAAHAATNEYVKFLGSQIGSADSRVGRSAALQGFTPVEFGHPKFFTGHAFELGKLNSDTVAHILAGKNLPGEIKNAIAKGTSSQDAIIDYFYKGGGKATMEKMAASRPEVKELFTTREGLRAYIYDVENGVQARLDEMTGGNPALLDLVAYGSVKLPNGKVIRMSQDPNLQRTFAADLKKNFSDAQELTGAKVNVRLRDTVNGMNNAFNTTGREHLTNAVDAWFRLNNNFEKNISMAPEFRIEYMRQVAKYAHSLDAEGLATVQNNLDKALGGMTIRGKLIPKNNPIRSAISTAKGDGALDINTVNQLAAEKAASHVKGLFYDAYNHRNIFHMTRFAIPFGQAWWDTLERWGKLATDNPLQAYKAAVVLNRLENDKNTSGVYGATGVTGYDPNQGFIQQDPVTGQKNVYVPFLGSTLGFLAGHMAQVNAGGGPFQVKTNPIGLNFALGGGSLAPGVGPGISLPVQMVIPNSWWTGLPPAVQNLIFPFGKPTDLSTAFVSAAVPSWASKLLPLFSNGSSSQLATLSTLKPTMDYLASGGGYDLLNPDDQDRLVKDSVKFANFFGAWTGIAQAIMPTSPLLSAVSKSKDSTVVAQAAIYASFQNLLNTTRKSDYYGAVRDTLDTYGVNNIYALITNTKGGSAPTNEAYQFLSKNPDVANKYPDVFTLFFPGGGFSQALYQQQIKSGQRAKLSAPQIEQQANYMLYMMAKDQVDVNYADDPQGKSDAMTNLKEQFGGVAPTKVVAGLSGRVANPEQYMINQVQKALKEPAFAKTLAGQATIDYLYVRDQALQDMAAMGRKTFKNSDMADWRQQLRDYADQINKHYNGAFATMFQSVFQGEVKD
jgi:hypothetical protein